MDLIGITKKMIIMICVLLLVFVAAGIIYYRSLSAFPFALGAFLGAGVSVLKVLMLGRAVEKAVDMPGNDAVNFVRLNNFLKLLLTGIVLVLSAVLPIVNLWGAVAGIMTFPLAAYGAKFFS